MDDLAGQPGERGRLELLRAPPSGSVTCPPFAALVTLPVSLTGLSNLIPKSGGNQFAGEFYATGTRGAFYSDNLNDELRAQGFEFAPVAWNYNVNPAFGGPIVEDKLWYFATGNYGQNKTYHLGYFFSENDPTTPEGIGEDRRVFQDGSSGQIQARITHQITPRHKMTHYFVTHSNIYNRVVPGGQPVTIESEALLWGDNNPAYLYTGRWTAPLTNRLLFEVAGSFERMTQHIGPDAAVVNRAPLRDLARGVDSNKSFITIIDQGYRRELQGSVSYVIGSHNFKAGLVYRNNIRYYSWPATGDIFQAWTLNGSPFAMLVQANPSFPSPLQTNCDCGMFVQDAWTRDRLTLNLGLRYDYFRNSVPAGARPAGFFSPAFDFDGIDNIPKWGDWSPRAGVAFDLFGDGTTALKASVGRYVARRSGSPIRSARSGRSAASTSASGPTSTGTVRCSTPTGHHSSTRSRPRSTRTMGCRENSRTSGTRTRSGARTGNTPPASSASSRTAGR